MASTVNNAFDEFMADSINLDSDDTIIAKKSRQYLVDQILTFPEKDKDFPQIYVENNIFFGSFARSTKKKPLDDIDILICLTASGCYYKETNNHIEIETKNASEYFTKLTHEQSTLLNSKKVINKFLTNLKDVPKYKKALIQRDMEAATLNLESYDWNFDIVPCFMTKATEYNKTYYIIPDGNGHWQKTDPRLDKKRIENINSLHYGHLLKVIRLAKYWNQRPTMPSIPSYLLENMILNYYASRVQNKAGVHVDVELTNVFLDIKSRIYSIVNDPKEIQGNLNVLSEEEKKKIATRAKLDYDRAVEARKFEDAGNHESAIKKWIEILGDKFPKFN